MVGARSLAELQLRIYGQKGLVWWMKYKLRLALGGYLLARTYLPTSGWMKCKIRLKLSQLGSSWQLGLLLGLS